LEGKRVESKRLNLGTWLLGAGVLGIVLALAWWLVDDEAPARPAPKRVAEVPAALPKVPPAVTRREITRDTRADQVEEMFAEVKEALGAPELAEGREEFTPAQRLELFFQTEPAIRKQLEGWRITDPENLVARLELLHEEHQRATWNVAEDERVKPGAMLDELARLRREYKAQARALAPLYGVPIEDAPAKE
jgi:hypothetical protein